jgi:aldehyde:ferredoxin oxidoreductase
LDEEGGPNHVSFLVDDAGWASRHGLAQRAIMHAKPLCAVAVEVGNTCVAPVICNTEKGEILYQPSFWHLGQLGHNGAM